MSGRIDITGQRFGRLTVIEFIRRGKRSYWKCLCDCGNFTVVFGGSLKKGVTNSCGCLRREMGEIKTLTHGKARRGGTAKIYGIWNAMKNRCSKPSQDSYYLYGGRGIKVCKRWQAFENFYADMGDPPDGMWIDRINGDGDYEPGNCRWATPKEQRANQKPMSEEHKEKSRANLIKAREARWRKTCAIGEAS
jgi:hypothetical protein